MQNTAVVRSKIFIFMLRIFSDIVSASVAWLRLRVDFDARAGPSGGRRYIGNSVYNLWWYRV